MRMATIITGYKQPELIERLIRSMQYKEGFDFYLHIDAKTDMVPFSYLASLPGTYIVPSRVKVYWAGYSLIEALLNGMDQIFASEKKYDFINHMSGQCYPIKPMSQLYDYYEKHIGYSFLESESPPSPWWEEAAMRYREYHFLDYGIRGGYRLDRLLTKLLPPRKLPFKYPLYGGPLGAYWTISSDCARYLHDLLRSDKKIRHFFKKSWGPDEYLINTLVMASPFSKKVINTNHRYIDWSKGGWHPAIFTMDDFHALQTTEKFIARKFDLTVDTKILDQIDLKLLS